MSAANADRIGLIGLGLMGGALAHRLIGAGYSVLGHDIDADKTRLVPGLEAAASVDEISKRCRRVVLAVYDTGQVESVVAELEAARRPVLLLCATTVEPRRIALLAARAARYGITLIEAPITGTSAEIEAGRGVGLLAGPKESVTLATDLLEVFCPQWFHMGSLGSAAKAALAINLVMQLNRAALAEGLVFAERLGLSPAAFLEALRSSPAGSQVMAVKGEKMVRREYSPQLPVTHTLATQSLKDAQFILETAHRLGQHLPMMEVNAALLAFTIAQGGMRRDSAAVIEAIRTSRPKTD